MKNLQFVIFLCCIIGISCAAADPPPCDDWKPYKDEKCFKIFDKINFQSFEDAEATCCADMVAGSSLVSIRSQEEQEFLFNFLLESSKDLNNVWLGAKRIQSNISNIFEWIDGHRLDYSNWEKEHPTNEDNRGCVQLNSAYEFYSQNSRSVKNSTPAAGKWVDVPCEKKNLVVCEKLQYWTPSRLQKILLDARKEFQDSLENLKQNLIPINFIYTQLSSQPDPKSLWPTVEWEDVTSEYSGLFFRAEGNNSATFGTIQDENAPRVTQVEYSYQDGNHDSIKQITLQPMWSEWVMSGGANGDLRFHRFYTSPGEVRPRNTAIRIWKRIG